MSATSRNRRCYFIVTITNFPYLLERTRVCQAVNEVNDPPPPPAHPPLGANEAPGQHDDDDQGNHGSNVQTVMPPLSILPFPFDAHEQILYDGLQYELREAIRAYLQRTARPYPIYMAIDLSNLVL